MNAGGGTLANTAATALTLNTTGITVASGGTLTLSATSAGIGFTQAASAPISGAGGLTVSHNGAGVTSFAADNSYTGATALNSGTLNLSGATSSTAFNVAGGTINVNGLLTAPNTITGITVAGGGSLSLVNGVGVPLSNLTTLSLGVGSGTTNLNMELGTNSDFLTVGGAATTANTINFNVTPIGGFGAGSYQLLTAASGLNGATYTFSALPAGYSYSKSVGATAVSLTATAVTGALYWKGGTDAKWNTLNSTTLLSNNWTNDQAGNNSANAIPGTANSVVFSSSGLTGAIRRRWSKVLPSTISSSTRRAQSPASQSPRGRARTP